MELDLTALLKYLETLQITINLSNPVTSGLQLPYLIKQVATLGRSLSTQMTHLGIAIMANLDR